MPAKKPPPVFEVFFKGTSIFPEKIPLRVLADALKAVQRLAAGAQTIEDRREHDQSITLLQVQRGSAVFRCHALDPDSALRHLRLAGCVLQNPGTVGESVFVLRPIDSLSSIALRLDCSIIIRLPNRGETLATIERESFESISRSVLVSGDTEIVGTVNRAGGATEMRAALRLPSRDRLLYCKVNSKETARELGRCLYEEVVAKGRATWIRDTWELFAFTIFEIYQPQTGSICEAFDAIREAGGKDWDRIVDPSAFLQEAGT